MVNTGAHTSPKYTKEEFANWKTCCKRITGRWDRAAAKNCCRGYNALKQNGRDMDASWPGTPDCVADEESDLRTVKKIFI